MFGNGMSGFECWTIFRDSPFSGYQDQVLKNSTDYIMVKTLQNTFIKAKQSLKLNPVVFARTTGRTTERVRLYFR